MKNYLYHESFHLQDHDLPIRIFLRTNDSGGTGCDFHWHEHIEFYYVISGSLILNINGSEKRIYPGDIGFVGWGMPHRGLGFVDGTRHYIIQIETEKMQYLKNHPVLSVPGTSIDPFISNDKKLCALFDCLLEEYQTQYVDFGLEVIASSMRIFVHMIRIHHNGKYKVVPNRNIELKHVHEILGFLSENFKAKISLTILGGSLGLSKTYCCRIFKKHTGKTIFTYYNEQKCHFAAGLIREGTTLQEASEAVGFSEYNYFSRVFKKTMGCRPTSYQNS